MKYSAQHAALWVAAYLVLALAPMLLAIIGPLPPARGFWTEFAVGLGFVGMAVLALQFVLSGRLPGVAATLGLDSMLQFHRQAGMIAFVFILAHPLILFATNDAYLDYLDPSVDLPRAAALSAVLGALVLLIVTTLWRQPIGLAYQWWRTVHGLLAFFVLFVGLVHALQVGHYVTGWLKQALWIGGSVAAMALLINTRVARPFRQRRRPYRVVEVREERGRAWTLALEPEGHAGMRFEPGQFAWLTLGPSPFSINQHPFSFSSSAEHPERLELTIKALGDFTSAAANVPAGTRAFLEGPYGAFTPPREPDIGVVFIVAGVGITPVISMLRTLRDRNDRRPLLLIYGNRHWDDVLFRDDLEALRSALDLTVIHVISDPPADWQGETGRIRPELVDRLLPEPGGARRQYFVCGPPAMMDVIEPYLRTRGVPVRDIFSERFAIV